MKRVRNLFDYKTVVVTPEDTLQFYGRNVEKLIDIITALHWESRSNQEHNHTSLARAVKRKGAQMYHNPQIVALQD